MGVNVCLFVRILGVFVRAHLAHLGCESSGNYNSSEGEKDLSL